MSHIDKMRMILVLCVAGLVLVGCHIYLLSRFARRWVTTPGKRRWVAVAMTLGLVLMMSLTRLGLESAASDGLAWIAYLWMGTGLTLLVAAGCLDLVRLVRAGIKGARGNAPVDSQRRDFLRGGAENLALGAGLTGAAVGLWQARGAFDVTRTEIKIEGLPTAFDGYRIVQVSDIHVGPTIKGSFVARIVEQINALEADLVAVTGDLVDGSLKHLSEHVGLLSGIQSKDGAYFVTGNHEYYSGADQWVEFVRSIGVEPLMNEHRIIRRGQDQLVLGGVTDYTAHRYQAEHRSDVKAAFDGTDPSLPRVLLAHQPRSVFDASQERVDLQISGHTHNGQMFPFNLVVAMAQPYLKGLARVVESPTPMWIYVHRGTGYWGPPNRLGIPPEVAVLTLRAA